MSNQKRKVSLDDYILCYQYFHRAIQNNRFMKGAQYEEGRNKAILAFYEIQADSPTDEAMHDFQLWLDDFVDVATWGRCYRALNQKKHLITNNKRTITVSDEAYSALKNSADQKNVSLSQALIELCAGSQSGVDNSSSNRLLNLIDLKPLNTALLKTNLFHHVPTPVAEKDSNVISLFGEEVVESSDEDLESDLEFSFFDDVREWPRKPQGWFFNSCWESNPAAGLMLKAKTPFFVYPGHLPVLESGYAVAL